MLWKVTNEGMFSTNRHPRNSCGLSKIILCYSEHLGTHSTLQVPASPDTNTKNRQAKERARVHGGKLSGELNARLSAPIA